MKIATWNVNSIRARMPRVVPWLEANRPDIVCLQETKVVDELFPFEYLEDCGYNVVIHGQKAYNGVAILANNTIENVVRGFEDGVEDPQARVLGCSVGDLMVLNLYVPNGSELGSEKFAYKMAWLERLRRFVSERYESDQKVVVTGDFNITFDDRDIHDPEGMRESIHCSTPEREALQKVMDFGLHDAFRKHHDEAGLFTWWDLRGGSFHKNQGLRIDHFLVTPAALDVCSSVTIDREERKGKSPSDHAPVVATLD